MRLSCRGPRTSAMKILFAVVQLRQRGDFQKQRCQHDSRAKPATMLGTKRRRLAMPAMNIQAIVGKCVMYASKGGLRNHIA